MPKRYLRLQAGGRGRSPLVRSILFEVRTTFVFEGVAARLAVVRLVRSDELKPMPSMI